MAVVQFKACMHFFLASSLSTVVSAPLFLLTKKKATTHQHLTTDLHKQQGLQTAATRATTTTTPTPTNQPDQPLPTNQTPAVTNQPIKTQCVTNQPSNQPTKTNHKTTGCLMFVIPAVAVSLAFLPYDFLESYGILKKGNFWPIQRFLHRPGSAHSMRLVFVALLLS